MSIVFYLTTSPILLNESSLFIYVINNKNIRHRKDIEYNDINTLHKIYTAQKYDEDDDDDDER